jgi:hypothetical protein
MTQQSCQMRRLLSFAVVSCLVLFAESQKAPNIVLLLGDDMGFNDIGYAGTSGQSMLALSLIPATFVALQTLADPTIKTPNMNALAADGIKLSALYTWNWCAPSRGAILTGRYVPNIGYEKAPDGSSCSRASAVGSDTACNHTCVYSTKRCDFGALAGPSEDGDGTGDAYMVPLEFMMLPAALKKQSGYQTVMAGLCAAPLVWT